MKLNLFGSLGVVATGSSSVSESSTSSMPLAAGDSASSSSSSGKCAVALASTIARERSSSNLSIAFGCVAFLGLEDSMTKLSLTVSSKEPVGAVSAMIWVAGTSSFSGRESVFCKHAVVCRVDDLTCSGVCEAAEAFDCSAGCLSLLLLGAPFGANRGQLGSWSPRNCIHSGTYGSYLTSTISLGSPGMFKCFNKLMYVYWSSSTMTCVMSSLHVLTQAAPSCITLCIRRLRVVRISSFGG